MWRLISRAALRSVPSGYGDRKPLVSPPCSAQKRAFQAPSWSCHVRAASTGAPDVHACSLLQASAPLSADAPAFEVKLHELAGGADVAVGVASAALSPELCSAPDAEQLLRLMGEEARAEMGGALLFYHLGEVQRSLAARGLQQPPLAVLIEALRAAGHTASASHSERKAIKVSATLDQIVEVVAAAGRQGETK
jgi:tRNA G26 N,N-dimethylase Trm1